MIQPDVSALAGLVAEAILYGILTVLTIGTLYVLLVMKKNQSINVPLVFTSTLMFCLATAQIIVGTVAIFEGFITLERPSRIKFLGNVTYPINAAKHAIFFTMLLLGDAIVIYRCYLLWSGSIKIVIIPILMSVASGVLSYITIWATQHPIQGAFILRNQGDWGTALFTLSLSANVIATSLSAYRMWAAERQFAKSQGSTALLFSRRSFKPVLEIIVQSGALNVAYLVVYIAVLDTGSGVLSIVSGVATPLIGIIFSMVIVRVGLMSTRDSNISTAPTHPIGPFPFSSRSGPLSDRDYESTIEMASERGKAKDPSLV